MKKAVFFTQYLTAITSRVLLECCWNYLWRRLKINFSSLKSELPEDFTESSEEGDLQGGERDAWEAAPACPSQTGVIPGDMNLQLEDSAI